jgi:hypothetical protein
MAFFLTTWSTVGWSCIITLYRFRHLFPIVMGGSLCSANDTQPSFIFEKCQKNVLAHDRIDVIIYVKVPFHSLSLLSFFLSTHPQFLWARVVRHDLESIGAIKRKWFGRKEGQSNHGVYGRNWYANSFLLLFFFTQNAIEANQKFFCTFHIELFVMIMHNLAILFIAKQYIFPQTNFLFLLLKMGESK